VQEQVARFFRQKPRTDLNPEEAVAVGAALQGEQLRSVLDGSVTVPSARAVGAATQDDTLASDTVPGTTVRQPPATPPPIPNARTTMRGTGMRPNTDDAPTVDRPTVDRPTLGRIPVQKIPAKMTIQEKTREGAIKDRVSGPEASTLIAGDLPLPGPPDTTRRGEPISSAAITSPIPAVHDITPHSLGIATVGGYCEHLVSRNSRLPLSKERIFTSARDGQVQIRIRICQGESRRLMDNTIIGDLVLSGLPIRDRGQARITVTFSINESGILRVSARDAQTGQEQRAEVSVLGAQTPEQIAVARQRMGQLRG
jgi:molecular chaperone DnaK (HSP70)